MEECTGKYREGSEVASIPQVSEKTLSDRTTLLIHNSISSTKGTWKIILIHQWPWQVLNFPAPHFKWVLKIKSFSVSPVVLIFWQRIWNMFLKRMSETIKQYLPQLFSFWAWAPKWKVWRNLLHHSTKAATFISKSKIGKPGFPRLFPSHSTAQVIYETNQNPPSFP